MWHGYFGIENLALSDQQRAALVAALRALGPDTHRSPACLCHWRTRLDNQAAIFEALFDEAALTVDAFRTRLAAIFDVGPSLIDHALHTVSFAGQVDTVIATFSTAGTDYLRMALFGGLAATWHQSGDEARAYIAANLDAWEEAP